MGSDLSKDSVNELLDLLDRRRPLLTSRPAFMTRQLVAGGLLYAERLLLAMRVCAATGLADASGGLLRTIWECWLIGEYLLLKGDEASEHLVAYYEFRLGQIAKHWPVEDGEEHPFEDLLPDPDARTVRLDLRAVAMEVSQLLRAKERTTPTLTDETAGYDMLYRFESTWSSHAGFGSFARYLLAVPEPQDAKTLSNYLGDPSRLEQVALTLDRSRRSGPSDGGIAFAAFWVAYLARSVFQEFGIGTSDLAPILKALYEAGNEAAPPPS